MPRYAVHCIVALNLACGFAVAQPDPPEPEFPTTGEANPQFTAADTWIQEFMRDRKIPGGSLAIAIDGEIKLARGYGYADRDAKTPVQPQSLFRIASVSKPITAVAVLKLVDEGKLKLDDKIIDVLKLIPRSGIRENSEQAGTLTGSATDYDPWWNDVTLHHLLTHTGGWDRNRSGDPMFMNRQAAEASATMLPVAHRHVIGLQFGRGLDYAPGERYAYSNFGYCLLGRAIEEASGEGYEKYVQEQLFAPLGITSARIGGSVESERADGEVCYYTIDGYRDRAVIGPQIGRRVLGQYGGWDQQLLDSHGGWIMSSSDLVKVGASLDEVGSSVRGKLLKSETARAMFTAQVPFDAKAESVFPGYGYGWTVTKLDDTPLVEHGGALSCTASILGRLGDRVWFAALFNLGRTADGKWLQSGLDRDLGRKVIEGTR